MATWKKVIVSGSTANLANIQVDGLTSGNVVIGGGTAGNLTTTAINGTGNIVATTGASGLVHSGSFSGSFVGSGAGLSGIAASFPVIEKTNIVTADKFFIQNSVGSTSEFITYGNLLTDLAGTNLAVEGTDSLTLATTITGLTSISSTSFTGSLQGTATTASFALNAVSASYAASTNNITNAITNNTDNRVLTATGGGTINGESTLTFDGTTLTVTGNEIITGNLTVQGTASFQNTTNLEVADRFVLFASGSNTTGDGGIVVQQGTQNIGELYGYDSGTTRWAFTSSFSANQTSFTPAAFITTTEVGASSPTAAPIYGGSGNGAGNIYVTTGGDIFIYA
jgi:hypothetical protein